MKPPVRMSSRLRSAIHRKDSSRRTMSPVRSHPPGSIAAAVASGSPQYPAKTCGPRTSSSPGSPSGTSTSTSTGAPAPRAASSASGSTTRTSVDGKGSPSAPRRRVGPMGVPATIGLVSVIP